MKYATLILPRRPMIRFRSFGLINPDWPARAGSRPRQAGSARREAADLRFRKPASPVASVAGAAPVNLALNSMTLAPRFRILWKSYRIALTRLGDVIQLAGGKSGAVQPAVLPQHLGMPVLHRETLKFLVSSAFARGLDTAQSLRLSAAPQAGFLERARPHHRKEQAEIASASMLYRGGLAANTRVMPRRDPWMPDAEMRETRHERHWLRKERDQVELLRTTVLRRYLLGTQITICVAGQPGPARHRRASNEARRDRPDQPQAVRAHLYGQEVPRPSDHSDRQRSRSSPAAPQPSERFFRSAPPISPAPAITAPQPATPALPAAQIDMGQLDRELWRRFEKRLRIEHERRGRQ